MSVVLLRQFVVEALQDYSEKEEELPILRQDISRQTVWLDEEVGFGLRKYQSGREVYVIQARMGGRVSTVTIGSTQFVTRRQAASVARRVRAYALVGANPSSDRKRIRSAPLYDDYLQEFWQRWSQRWKPSTLITHNKYRRLYLEDAFKGLSIDGISDADVVRWFAKLNSRLGPGGANRVLSILNSMFNKAEDWGYRLSNTNPCRAVRENPKRKCERFLSIEELGRIGGVLSVYRNGDNPVLSTVATAITLILLTGCRVGEIMSLQWSDVHGSRLKLRDSKTGPRTVWCGKEAKDLIVGLPKRQGVPWLFWNVRIRKPIINISNYWYEMRAEAGLNDVRLHDLRHTFASHAAMGKETLPMIGRLLGRSTTQSTARYAHLDNAHVLAAAERVGRIVEEMMA